MHNYERREWHQVSVSPAQTEKTEVEKLKIKVINYSKTSSREWEASTVKECFIPEEASTVTWLNVDSLNNIGLIVELGEHFGLHPLLIEDVITPEQRPKLDESEDHIFLITRMLRLSEKTSAINAEQVSIILSKDSVLTFQERPGDVFSPVRQRIREGKGIIRRMGSDYLVYSLLNALVDNYFIIAEKIGDKIEDLEEELVTNSTMRTIQSIHAFKRELILIRKSVWPMREVINHLETCGSELIKRSTNVYLRDLYDNAVQVIDAVETYRDLLAELIDAYLSSMSNKMNEVMKVLTVVGTIFIPLTFISGIYGMNFSMPELQHPWGYPLVMLSMLVTAISMILYMKIKKWF